MEMLISFMLININNIGKYRSDNTLKIDLFYQPSACPNDCSGHGRCVSGQCICDGNLIVIIIIPYVMLYDI